MIIQSISVLAAATILACGADSIPATGTNAFGTNAPVALGERLVQEPDAKGWFSLFDGQTLSGWLSFAPGSWTAQSDGTVMGKGPQSHLFSPSIYRNVEFKAEVKLNHS